MHKKALLMYWHGLGDVIMLTPFLKELESQGYEIDLMCRESVKTSHLLDEYDAVKNLIIVKNPWQSPHGFSKQSQINFSEFNGLKKNYDWANASPHAFMNAHKMDTTSQELNLQITDKSTDVFISDEIELDALEWIQTNYPNGYIYKHTHAEWHKYHDWESDNFIKKHLPDLPVVDTGYKGNHKFLHENINFTFVIAREAKHRVLCSSVMVHALDALDVVMDAVSYGRPARHAWPHDMSKIKRIRESGKWIKLSDDILNIKD